MTQNNGTLSSLEFGAILNEVCDSIKLLLLLGYRLGYRRTELLTTKWSAVRLGTLISEGIPKVEQKP